MNIVGSSRFEKKADAEFLHCVQRRFKQAFSLCHGNYRKLIEEVTNLNVYKYLPGHLGGAQQLSSQIEHDQMDLVIFLRDPSTAKSHEPNVNNVVMICDMYNIPIATNVATAELLIKSLERGDMEWREMYR
mgnify:FL=1